MQVVDIREKVTRVYR